MKEHGDNGSTTTARGLPPSSHISSDRLIRDQELQHLVTSSIPSPPYGGLSLINASAALVFGADPIYSTHLFASLAANNPNARFQLPIPIPLALQPASASHPANPLHHHHHHHHQRNIFHHLPAAAVPAFAGLPGATLPNAAQLDILSSWVNEQASKSIDDRKITSTTTPNPTTPNNNKNGSGKSNRKNKSQVNSKNNKNLSSGNVIKLSKRSANGSANLEVAKTNRKNKAGRHHLNHEGIVSSSENDVVIKKEEFEKDAEPLSMSITESIIKPFIVDNMPVGRISDVQKMEIEQSPPPSMKGGKRDNSNGSPSPNNRIANNNNANHKTQGQTSPGQNGSRDKVFTCPTCNRTFGYKHVLQNHERTHTGEKPFECTICMKKFTRDHHLKTHMRLHTGEKPYQCTHCDRQFVQVANLRRHLRVHTGERPYACQLCSSRFSDSNQLKAHMLIHKGEKPYSCKECGGSFRRRHHLAHHKCSGEETSAKSLFHQNPPSPSSPDTSPPQLLTPSSAAGSDRGDSGSVVGGKRERKCRETRRIIRLDTLPVAATVSHHSNPLTFVSGSVVPEQDHPEDLSMSGNTGRSRSYSGSSSSITGSSSPSPRNSLNHGNLLLRPYCNSSSEETPELFSDEELRAADSSTNGSVVPEQDHPEDLSMSGNTGRSRSYSGSSSSITGSSSSSPRNSLNHGNLLLRPYCNSSSEETPELFSDEELRAADSSTNGKNESSCDDISFPSHHE